MWSTVSGRTRSPAWPCNNIAGSGDINRAGYPPQVSFPLSLSKLTRRDVRARFSSTDTNKRSSPRLHPLLCQLPPELVEYLNESWTSYHATATASALSANGIYVMKDDEWKISRREILLDSQYVFCCCLRVREKYEPGKGFHIISTHRLSEPEA